MAAISHASPTLAPSAITTSTVTNTSLTRTTKIAKDTLAAPTYIAVYPNEWVVCTFNTEEDQMKYLAEKHKIEDIRDVFFQKLGKEIMPNSIVVRPCLDSDGVDAKFIVDYLAFEFGEDDVARVLHNHN